MNNDTPADAITHEQYESAVKGRQDFRNAYRNLLPVLRAAEELSRLWRTKGQRVDDEVFFNAINAVDVAVTGGGAKPDPEHLTRTTSLAAQDETAEAYEIGKRDGYEQAVQEIDVMTGGDGEYRYCTNGDPDRHTPDAATMKARIADRFNAAPSLAAQDGLAKALRTIVALMGNVDHSKSGGPNDAAMRGGMLMDCKTIAENALASSTAPSLAAQDGLVKHMANRFLGWKLPENFHPDNGISFKPTFNDHMDPPMRHNPIGTNLFNATQAEEMVRYMLEGYDQ